MFDDAFKITDVRKLNFVLNVKNSKEMLESATMRLSAQRFKFLKNIKNFQKMFENASLRSNVYVNIFI